MELEATPDPTPEEREAVAAALRSLAVEALADDGRTAWWRAGVRENVAAGEHEPGSRSEGRP